MKKMIAGVIAVAIATFAQADQIQIFAATNVTCTKDPAATPATGCDYTYAPDFSLVYASKSVALYCWPGASVTVSGPAGDGGLIVDNVLNINDQSVVGFASWSYATPWNDPASLGVPAIAAYTAVPPVTVPVTTYGWNFLQFDLVDEGGVYANTELFLSSTNCTIEPKLKLCHKGKTITISNDAVKAHIDHGDAVDSLNVGCN